MTRHIDTNRSPRRRQGFTLVEVLVAIIVLLVGVVAAIRIFPPGFNTFVETQQTNVAMKATDQWVNIFKENPNTLPDAIYPVVDDWTESSAAARTLSFDDLTAVDFRNTASVWYAKSLYPLGYNRVSWPLWQPRSARVFRRVVGERCIIPTEYNVVSTAVSIALVPKYLPHFGPIIPNGQFDGGSYVWEEDTNGDQCPLIVYDLRYRKISRNQLENLSRDGVDATDKLYYALDVEAKKLLLLPDDQARAIRLTFSYIDAGDIVQQVGPLTIRIPKAADMGEIEEFDLASLPQVTGSIRLLNGSEQLNRAYRFYSSDSDAATIQRDEDPSTQEFQALSAAQQTANVQTYLSKLSGMPSGSYYIERMTGSTSQGNLLLGTIYFAKADAGRTVKIDYTVADWNILHEDHAVNGDGEMVLELGAPKIVNRPAFPREANTWGLYRPMQDNARNVVMGLVDTRTGLTYHVVAHQGGAKGYTYGLEPQGSVPVPDPVIGVDMSNAERGRLRLGGVPAGISWRGTWVDAAVRAVAYQENDGVQRNGKVYVCLQDHGNGTSGSAPGTGMNWRQYWRQLEENDIDWQRLRGQTFRVFYRAQRDWTLQVYKPPAMFWYTTAAPTALGWDKFTMNRDERRLYVPGIYEGQSVAVDYTYREDETDDTSPLLHVSGEMHVIPARDVTELLYSTFTLRHRPAANTRVIVRGVSVTVRAMWIQPRSGKAYLEETSGNDPDRISINERWQAKSVTVILPSTKE